MLATARSRSGSSSVASALVFESNSCCFTSLVPRSLEIWYTLKSAFQSLHYFILTLFTHQSSRSGLTEAPDHSCIPQVASYFAFTGAHDPQTPVLTAVGVLRQSTTRHPAHPAPSECVALQACVAEQAFSWPWQLVSTRALPSMLAAQQAECPAGMDMPGPIGGPQVVALHCRGLLSNLS